MSIFRRLSNPVRATKIGGEDELAKTLAEEGVQLYRDDGKWVPSVDVKVKFYAVGPKTRKALDDANVPEAEREKVVEEAWEDATENWWMNWSQNEDIKKLFGRGAEAGAAGRSAGHLVVRAPLWAFTKETKHGDTVLDQAKVNRWLKIVERIEKSVSRPVVDANLAYFTEQVLENRAA